LVLCFHVVGAAALLARWSDETDQVADAPVMMIELALASVAPQTKITEMPPGPQQTEATAQPQPQTPTKKIEINPPLAKDSEFLVLPPHKPPEMPREKKPKRKLANLTSAPSTAEQEAEHAAAPAPGAVSHNPSALPQWKSALVAQLERYKRYPSEAQVRGEHGVAQLAFSVDRSGGVHGVHIVHSSGSDLLDQATLALIERAQPLPPPPPEIHGAQIAIVVPIQYSAR